MIGIIPIGGDAQRMNGLPKFLLPVGDTTLLNNLYKQMVEAGAQKIIVDTSTDNRRWVELNMPEDALIYEWNAKPMSKAILMARDYIESDETVLFGMPDTYWSNTGVYQDLLGNCGAAIASVAVWDTPPSHRPKHGMCVIEDTRIIKVIDKPVDTPLNWGWEAIVWQPAFWRYIEPQDPHPGFALQRAIEAGEIIHATKFSGRSFNCGTKRDYYECVAYTLGAMEHV